jgi:phage recombination protein Bet
MTDTNGNGHALPRSRLPLAPAIAKEYEITAPQWRLLVDQVFPGAKTPEAVMLALAYCRERHLDIYKRPVHIVPMWSASAGRMIETVWPGIAEVRTTAMRTHDYAGIDEVVFGPNLTQKFSGKVKGKDGWHEITKEVTFPEWASVTVYRLDRQARPCAYRAKIFWLETYATIGQSDVPNDMWESRAYGQLDKCVEAAALRKAFPEELGNTYSAEEMEGKTIDITPTPDRPEPTKIPSVPITPGSHDATGLGRQARPKDGTPDAGASTPAALPHIAPVPSADPIDLEIPEAFDRRHRPSNRPTDAEIDQSQAFLASVLGIEE